MGNYLTKEFVEEVHTLKNELNTQLGEWSAPAVGESTDEYERTETFVALNEWLRDAKKEDLKQLSHTFGLLPIIYGLSGINVLQATLLQDTARLDVIGIITYIRTALQQTIGDDVQAIRTLCRTMFPDYSEDETHIDMRSLFISLLISNCMNTRDDITCEQSLFRATQPILAG